MREPIEVCRLKVKIAELRVEFEKLELRVLTMQARKKRGPRVNTGFDQQFKNTALRFGRVKGELFTAEQELKTLKEQINGN
jgi:hypothetical protein